MRRLRGGEGELGTKFENNPMHSSQGSSDPAIFGEAADFTKFALRRRAKQWHNGMIGCLCVISSSSHVFVRSSLIHSDNPPTSDRSTWFKENSGAGLPRARFTEPYFDAYTKSVGSLLLAWNDLHERTFNVIRHDHGHKPICSVVCGLAQHPKRWRKATSLTRRPCQSTSK